MLYDDTTQAELKLFHTTLNGYTISVPAYHVFVIINYIFIPVASHSPEPGNALIKLFAELSLGHVLGLAPVELAE